MKHKKPKTKYRLRTWREYNRALVQRGSLTMWITRGVVQTWHGTQAEPKRGHPRTYTDTAILTMATLQEIYQLGLHQAQGLMESIGTVLHLAVAIPDYSTLSRRRATLEVVLPRTRKPDALHVVVDSTGVKVYGEGEGKVRQHGYTRRRTWRKVHVGVDETSGEIIVAVVTTNAAHDSPGLPDLLAQVEEGITQVLGDGAYDLRVCYDAIRQRRARAAIPPQHNAKIWQLGNTKADRLVRDENLRRIRQIGRAGWKRECGYHRRSLAETTVFRLKTIFGDRVSARSFAGQAAQVLVRCAWQTLLDGIAANPDQSLSALPLLIEAERQQQLVAYVVPHPASRPTIAELRSVLRAKLPEYMVPATFVFLDTLPLTPNGKVDRRALPVPDQSRPELHEAFAAPRTQVEEALVGIWASVLGLKQVGIHDNFFELGGHSLLATQVMSRVRSALQVELSLHTLFERPTIAGLAEAVAQAQRNGASSPPAIVPIAREAHRMIRLQKL